MAGYFPPSAVTRTPSLGFVGTCLGAECDARTYLNDGGSAFNVWTITISASSASTTHAVDIYRDLDPSVKSTITTLGGSTTTIAATNLRTAILADAYAYGIVSVTQASNVLTLTGRQSGEDFTVDNATNATPAESVSGAAAERVLPGRAMVRTGGAADKHVKGRMAISSAFTAQSWAYTIASMSAGRLRGYGTFAGVPFDSTVAFTSNNDTTVAALVTALDSAVGTLFGAGQSIEFTAASGVITAASDVAGSAWEFHIDISGATDATVALARTGGPDDPTYSLPAAFAGIAGFTPDMAPSTIDGTDTGARANSAVKVYRNDKSAVLVASSATATQGTGVWVDLTTGAGRGLMYTAASAASSRVPLWHPRYGWLATFSGDNDTGISGVLIHRAL